MPALLEQEYEVDRILDRRVEKGKTKYLVRFRGYGPLDDEWLPAEALQADAKIAEFERHVANAKPLNSSAPLAYVEAAKKGARVKQGKSVRFSDLPVVGKKEKSVDSTIRRNPRRLARDRRSPSGKEIK
jgi:hypothetical protein